MPGGVASGSGPLSGSATVNARNINFSSGLDTEAVVSIFRQFFMPDISAKANQALQQTVVDF